MALATKRASLDVIYPSSDDMGEHEIQRLIAELLRPLLARFLAEHGRVAHVGADQFIYWEQGNPTKRLAPDVYVLPGVDPNVALKSWKVWEGGVRPSFALEVASDDIAKDYEDGPVLYSELGVEELCIVDPHATAKSRTRVRLQLFRKLRGRGLVRVEATQGDRVWSKTLDAWIRIVGTGDSLRVRLGEGRTGDELYPTEAEAERQGREAERQGRLAAEAEVARLTALLTKK